jgi:hypothetical protein
MPINPVIAKIRPITVIKVMSRCFLICFTI